MFATLKVTKSVGRAPRSDPPVAAMSSHARLHRLCAAQVVIITIALVIFSIMSPLAWDYPTAALSTYHATLQQEFQSSYADKVTSKDDWWLWVDRNLLWLSKTDSDQIRSDDDDDDEFEDYDDRRLNGYPPPSRGKPSSEDLDVNIDGEEPTTVCFDDSVAEPSVFSPLGSPYGSPMRFLDESYILGVRCNHGHPTAAF